MSEDNFDRRDFLKSAVLGGAAAATVALPSVATAQGAAAAPAPGYAFLTPEEAAFVETLVDHMVPADQHTPKGTDVGINIYIDRALAGGWGKGDKLYMQGPWAAGVPEQGYQLPLLPADLYRFGIASTNAHCVKAFGKPFDQITSAQREEVLKGLDSGKLTFESGLSSRVFFGVVYQTVMEGMFADPIYGGNKDKVGWKMLGFPGVVQVNAQNIAKYKNKQYKVDPVGIARDHQSQAASVRREQVGRRVLVEPARLPDRPAARKLIKGIEKMTMMDRRKLLATGAVSCFALPYQAKAQYLKKKVKITDVKVMVIRGTWDWNLFKIETDAGVHGIGEGYWGPGVKDITLNRFKEQLVGEDPLNVVKLYTKLLFLNGGYGATSVI